MEMEPNPEVGSGGANSFGGLWKRVMLGIATIGCSIIAGSLIGGTFAAIGCVIWWWMYDHQLPPREEWLDLAIVGLGFGAEFGCIFGLVAAFMWYVRSPLRLPTDSPASDK